MTDTQNLLQTSGSNFNHSEKDGNGLMNPSGPLTFSQPSNDGQEKDDDEPADGNRVLGALLFGMCFGDFLILNVASLLPTYIEKNFPKINSLEVGILMACYPIFFLICAPFVGNYMQSFGRKNVVVLGASLMTLSTAIFGLAAFFKSPWGFILVSTLARIIQGVADACITVTMPSIICREFPKNQEKYLGYLNMSIGVGTCLGPILGALMYRYLNYTETFGVIACLIGVSAVVQAVVIPSRINDSGIEAIKPAGDQPSQEKSTQITYGDFLKNPKILLLLSMEVAAMMLEYYVDPILGPQFVNLGWSEDQVGYGFATVGGSFALGSFTAGFLCSKMHRNYVILIGITGQIAAMILLGPSQVLQIPALIPIMFGGLFLDGFFAAFVFVCVIPGVIEEINESRKNQNGEDNDDDQINDKASGLYNVAYALGGAISPVMGGGLYDAIGFQSTADVMALVAIAFTLLFFVGGVVPLWLKKSVQTN